ncbi:MAG: hypothetical protein DI547_14160 [Sphingobium sp.]|jgi:hypothetical protein|nr:MAG: hypothetical protein DI547_14160 [Sphingobium sp.]
MVPLLSMVAIFFWTLMLMSCAYAAFFGGRDGRWASIMIVAATALTLPATLLDESFARTQLPVTAVDILLLLGLYMLAMRSARYFPIWMTAFQLITVTTHLSTIAAPNLTPKIYQAMETVWAIPCLLSMVAGVMLDRRRLVA